MQQPYAPHYNTLSHQSIQDCLNLLLMTVHFEKSETCDYEGLFASRHYEGEVLCGKVKILTF